MAPTSSPQLSADAFQLDLARPAADQIYGLLKQEILSATLAPGQPISETEIGNLFNASRTPAREAIGRLREEGLLITYPSRGTYVSKLSVPQIVAAQFVREALEVATVRRLCQTPLPQAARDTIAKVLERQRHAVASGDKRLFREMDDRFHAALAEATGIERLDALLIREKSALDRLRVLAIVDEGHTQTLLAEHEALFDALLRQDEEKAIEINVFHLRRVLKIMALVQENRPDYFA